MALNRTLPTLMDERGWLPVHVASKLADRGCPVHVDTISRWMTGKNNPNLKTLTALSEVFEVSLDELVKGSDAVVRGAA